MTLATFHADIKSALRRGSSVDSDIPGWVADAALWLEQNYSFGYMERTLTAALDPLSSDPNLVDVEDRVKSIKFVRALAREPSDPTVGFRYLEKVSADQVSSVDLGDPSYYWIEGQNNIWLDAKVQQTLTVQVGGTIYTDWPTSTSANPTLLRYYPNLLKAQTLIEAAIDLKDERMAAAYDAKFQRALQAALVAEEEGKREDTSVWMGMGR